MTTDQTIGDVITEKYMGLPLAILCARYWYRGIVSETGRDYITLSHVRAVEVTGPASSPTPTTEDPVPSDLTISTGAIEQFCQPLWVWHEMPIKPPAEIAKMIEAMKVKRAAEQKAAEQERRKQEEERQRSNSKEERQEN
jgi:hypothetical protein